MALVYLAWEQIVLEERVLIMGRRLERRILRDGQNPFELPNDEFMGAFRLSQQLVINIIDALRTSLQHKRTSGLSPELQVLVCLHFYAQGSYQKGLVGNSILNISQPSVSRCIHYVTKAINQRLLRKWIKFPMTSAERQRARETFAHAHQPFEGTIGAIDCTYIHILAPRQHEEAYVNHHGKHSLNVQAIVNSKLQVLNINARYPGARNDSYIWSMSPVHRGMEYHYNNGERQTWLIGDAGYPLEPWLMTPLPHYPEGTRQFEYTKKIWKARNVVERFFGVLKSMWRCLSYQRVLMYSPDMAGKIVNACATLHNIRIHCNLPTLEDFDIIDQENNQDELLENQPEPEFDPALIGNERGPRAIAQRIQKQLMLEQFGNYRDGNNDQ